MIEDQEKIYKIKENQKKWPNFQRYKVTKKKSTKSKEIRLKSGQKYKVQDIKAFLLGRLSYF